MEGGKKEKDRNLFIYFFYFFYFLFLILFYLIFFTFQNDENLFWGYQNRNFLPGKSISHREMLCEMLFPTRKKKSGKITLPPQKKISCYAPALPRVNISLNLHYLVLLCTSFIIPLCSSKFLRYYVSNLISWKIFGNDFNSMVNIPLSYIFIFVNKVYFPHNVF